MRARHLLRDVGRQLAGHVLAVRRWQGIQLFGCIQRIHVCRVRHGDLCIAGILTVHAVPGRSVFVFLLLRFFAHYNTCAGYWSSALGATSSTTCQACGMGTYSTQPGAISIATCTKCPAGTASPALNANSPYTCAKCEGGQYSSYDGAAYCSVCPKGTATSLAV